MATSIRTASIIMTFALLGKTAAADPQSDAPVTEPQTDDPATEPQTDAPTAEPQSDTPDAKSKSDAPDAEPRTDTPDAKPATLFDRISAQAFVDTYYGFNFNRPAKGDNFVSGTGTTAKRANEFGLNLAALDLTLAPAPVGAHLTLNWGSGADVVHAAEVSGSGNGPNVWRAVGQATVSYQTKIGRGLLIEAGIMPSHIGLEVFWSKDNWNYTRSWIAEFSPYYQTGLKIAYPFSDNISGQLYVLNGWQVIGENNESKTVGTQLAWNSKRVSVALNTLAGPETAGDDDNWRLFGDLVLVVRPTSRLSIAATADAGYQQRTSGGAATWVAAAALIRLGLSDNLAVAVRGEHFRDKEAQISGAAQTLTEGTATVEYRPAENLIVKLEGRIDSSSAPVFQSDTLAADGSPEMTKSQSFVVLGAVASF